MADTPGNAKAERGPKGTNHDGRRRRDRPGGEPGRSDNENRGPAPELQQAARGRDGEPSRPARRDDRRDDRRGGGGGGGGRPERGRPDNRSEAPLTAGLFAGVADREMPCRVGGCENTWIWFGHQQIRSLGKPPPKRMCDDHLAEFEGIEDKQMPCRNSWCTNTWLWPRFAQLRALEHEGKVKPPYRLCDWCFNEERTTEDLEIRCKIPECHSTWTWPRQAQLKHRAWVRRQLAIEDAEERGDDPRASQSEPSPARVEARSGHGTETEPHETEPTETEPTETESHETESTEAESNEAESNEAESSEAESSETETTETETESQADSDESQPKRRRRKRKRRRKINEGPPERLCDRCNERINHLQPIEVPCKVHGCHSTWTWDREGQLRAWSALDGQTNVTELPQPPRRMCMTCVEFVRRHGDRDVRCGRPGCEKTWSYKTGAQLQDYLAGRTQDPIRLCEECIRSQFTISTSNDGSIPAGSEIMPCLVSGCSGTWVYMPGMKLSSTNPEASEAPADRICDDCRSLRGVPGRDPRRVRAEQPSSATEESASPSQTPVDEDDVETDAELAAEDQPLDPD